MTWTHFRDMHSGGEQKLAWPHIFIEAPEEEAARIFYRRFGRSPYRVTCTCCGQDYAIQAFDDLAEATACARNCNYSMEARRWVEEPSEYRPSKEVIPFTDYLASNDALVIYADDIQPHEREGTLPKEGYVWVGD